MTNDKALEAAARAIASEMPLGKMDRAAHVAPLAISAFLSALPGEAEVVAWRGDDAGGGRKFTAMSRVSEIWADQGLMVTPLVTLAAFQAMQARAEAAEARAHTASLGWADALNDLEAAEARAEAAEEDAKQWEDRFFKMDANFDRAIARAEAAERERDAFRDMADGYGKLDAELAIAERRAEAAEARVKKLEEERDALRKVISECASALPNGAFISPKASVEFMAMLPAEIASVCTALKGGSNG